MTIDLPARGCQGFGRGARENKREGGEKILPDGVNRESREGQTMGRTTLEEEAKKAQAKGTRLSSTVDANYIVSVGGSVGH